MGLDAAVFQDDEHAIMLACVRIGNVSAVAELRQELESLSSGFPLLLQKVIYNGTHCGDFIPLDLVEDLRTELSRIPNGSVALNQFRAEMIGLCEIALKNERAIEF